MTKSPKDPLGLPDDDAPPAVSHGDPWFILVVDDEPDIHSVTRLVLGGMSFKNRPIRILNAHSAAEAREILRANRDIAVVMLDVVMELDDAGLQLVRFIREVLNNLWIQIVVQTGQPGKAPERTVILDYDINAYRTKTEMTSDKLMATVIAALRGYDNYVNAESVLRGENASLRARSPGIAERRDLADLPMPDASAALSRLNDDMAKLTKAATLVSQQLTSKYYLLILSDQAALAGAHRSLQNATDLLRGILTEKLIPVRATE